MSNDDQSLTTKLRPQDNQDVPSSEGSAGLSKVVEPLGSSTEEILASEDQTSDALSRSNENDPERSPETPSAEEESDDSPSQDATAGDPEEVQTPFAETPEEQPLSKSDIATFLLDYLGVEGLQHMRRRLGGMFPGSDPNGSIHDWVGDLIGIMPQKEIDQMGRHLQRAKSSPPEGVRSKLEPEVTPTAGTKPLEEAESGDSEATPLDPEETPRGTAEPPGEKLRLLQLEEQLEEQRARCEHWEAEQVEVDRLRGRIKALERAATVPLNVLINEFVGREEPQRAIRELLREAQRTSTPDLGHFVVGFCRGWQSLTLTLTTSFESEVTRLEAIDDALRKLLRGISKRYIPQRRALLTAVAHFVNQHLEHHELISPEASRSVNPKLHNVAGVGGTRIVEGRSFAVVRKDTKQTVRFADIEAE